jgi:Protein of unknown function (DUF2599)
MSNEIIASIRKLLMTGITIGIVSFLVFSLPTLAQENTTETDIIADQITQDTRDTLKSIDKVDPNKPKTTRLKRKRGEIISKENNQIKNFKRHKKLVEFSRNGTKVDIGVPKEFNTSNQQTLEDKIVYKSNSENVDLIVENVDGGIRQVILIKDKDQPNRYEFPMNLEEGQKLVSNQGESINVVDKDNKRVLTILKPWAKDANGKDLQTYYKIENNTLVQYINFDNAVFPITADPTWCGNQIHSTQWQNWKNPISLGIIPTWCGRFLSIDTWDAWTEVYNKTPYHWQWNWEERRYGTNKYWSMFNQFKCHFVHPASIYLKSRWNIEPTRPHVSLWSNILANCNP